MSWKDEAVKRILKLVKLPQECIKHLHGEKESLANQILHALLKASSKKDEPVKLSEIAEVMYGTAEKEKQDIIRLTMDKTLIRCGIVDKIYFAERDVRYFPTAYRFQEIRRIETSAGEKIEQLVGNIVELPRDTWPVPGEYFELTTSKSGYEDALRKLEQDLQQGRVSPQTYQQMKERLQKDLEIVSKKLKGYEAISDLMTQPS